MSARQRNTPPRRGFIFDLERCTGCHACTLACSTENGLDWGSSWRQVLTYNAARRPGLPVFHLSLACNHCDAAPCAQQCPARAIGRPAATGAVLIDGERCIDCGYCRWVCPFDAPRPDRRSRVMTKCTLCHDRLLAGGEPACVELCPTTALRFAPLVAGTERVPGFPATAARPAIRFVPLRAGGRPPATTWEVPRELLAEEAAEEVAEAAAAGSAAAAVRARALPPPIITLRAEWPLLVFTLSATALAGSMLAAAAGAPAPGLRPFLGATALALATSLLHLGRRQRAGRALANLRHSWLSREVASFGAFATLAAIHLAGGLGSNAWSGAAAAAQGACTLFAIDRVYDPVRPRGAPRLDSADTLPTGLLVASALLGRPAAFALLGGLKLLAYARRCRAAAQHGGGGRGGGGAQPARRPRNARRGLLAGLLRAGLGVALPLAILGPWTAIAHGWALAALAAGEVIDRAQFYAGLEVRSPRSQIQIELGDAWRQWAAAPPPVAVPAPPAAAVRG